MNKVGKIILGLLVTAIQTFVLGVVLMFLWNWFIAPLGVVQIGYWLALGISLTINTFFIRIPKREEDKNGDFLEAVGTEVGYIIALLLIWGMGAIIHLFI